MANIKRNYLTPAQMSLYSAYKRGDRSPEATEANRLWKVAAYADPNNPAKPRTLHQIAVKRVRAMNGFVAHDPNEIQAIIQLYLLCHQMNLRDGKMTWSVDHIFEIADGGGHTIDNLRIITSSENSKKGQRARRARNTRPSKQGDQ